jgi:hypothetical protein
MRWVPMIRRYCLQLLFVSLNAVALVSACAGVSDQKDWIKVGETTREDVVARYGQPDLIMASEGGGETAIYRPRDPRPASPQVQIPTVQAGPLGTVTTKTEPVKPGLGTRPTNSGVEGRPEQELRIRYDARGIVQEVIR